MRVAQGVAQLAQSLRTPACGDVSQSAVLDNEDARLGLGIGAHVHSFTLRGRVSN
jgi:hypothetical protein